jgi:hypothetical protein
VFCRYHINETKLLVNCCTTQVGTHAQLFYLSAHLQSMCLQFKFEMLGLHTLDGHSSSTLSESSFLK